MEHTDTQANTSNRWWRTTNIIKCGNGNTDKSRQQPKKRDSRATKNTDSVRRNRRDICRFSGVNIFQSINVSRRLVCLIFFFSKGVTWIKNKHTNASEMLFIVGSPISITKKKELSFFPLCLNRGMFASSCLLVIWKFAYIFEVFWKQFRSNYDVSEMIGQLKLFAAHFDLFLAKNDCNRIKYNSIWAVSWFDSSSSILFFTLHKKLILIHSPKRLINDSWNIFNVNMTIVGYCLFS